MTINKSQCQTFDRVAVFFREPVFNHGRLYVAVSRARSFDGLRLEQPKNYTSSIQFCAAHTYCAHSTAQSYGFDPKTFNDHPFVSFLGGHRSYPIELSLNVLEIVCWYYW